MAAILSGHRPSRHAGLVFLKFALCITLSLYLWYVSTNKSEHSHLTHMKVGIGLMKSSFFRPVYALYYKTKPSERKMVLLLMLILCGDIELNPGPRQEKVYPCGLCEYPVTWSMEGVACDECNVWHHKTCLSMCSNDFDLLDKSHIAWKCCRCDSINCDSFTFHSYELLLSNSFSPLTDMDSTVDSVCSKPFSPLFTSSPRGLNFTLSHTNQNVPRDKTCSSASSMPYSLPNKQNLRILNVNCRSILENKCEFLAAINYIKPDIICGTESWLRGKKPGKPYDSNAIMNPEIFPDNYNVYRNDRTTRGGGVFVAVQSNITSTECTDLIPDCELELVKVSLKDRKDLYIGSFYMPKRNATDLSKLQDSITRLNGGNPKHLVLCGDFNCPDIDWETPSLITNKNTQDPKIQQQLIDLSNELDLNQIHNEATREGNLLDLTFTTNPSLVKSSVNAPGISDHAMTICDMDIKPAYTFSKPRKIYKFHKANWDTIKSDCSDISRDVLEHMKTTPDVESAWKLFKSRISSSVEKNVPSKMSRSKRSLPWINSHINKQLKRKSRLYNKAKRSNTWDTYRKFSKNVRKEMRQAEWNYTNNVIQEGLEKNNSKPFWNYIKSKKQDNIGVSPLKKKGNLFTDSKSKADILVDQFKSVFSTNQGTNAPIENRKKTPDIPNLTINQNGVQKLLSALDTKKAVGPDNIPNAVLKNCASELSSGLSAIFQLSVDSGKLPEDWRNANITPVFKKGDRHLAENYRPVSLTSVLCKVLEHIICKHILGHLEKHKVLTDLNHGFRSGYSTETQLLVTLQDLLKAQDKKTQMDTAILDFSKAFDTVPHDKLLQKVESYGITGNIHLWLKSFLKDRKMKVLVEGEHSKEAEVLSGVPQGTVLGPLLFLCHINDLPDVVNSQVRLFADDCLLYRPIRSQKDHDILQQDLINLEQWAIKWGMRFNAKKCYILSIRSHSSRFYQLDNTILKEVDSNPYLGITISNDLQWQTHISKISKKASSTLGFIRRNLKHAPQDCKRAAYIALVRSTLEYAAIVWDPYKQSDIINLEKIQRQAARFIKRDYRSRHEGCVTDMLKELGLPSLQDRRREKRLVMLFKIARGMVPAIKADVFLSKLPAKRHIKSKTFCDYQTQNIVNKFQVNNSGAYKIDSANSDQYKNSFFVRTITDWNSLSDSQINSETVNSFKEAVHIRD